MWIQIKGSSLQIITSALQQVSTTYNDDTAQASIVFFDYSGRSLLNIDFDNIKDRDDAYALLISSIIENMPSVDLTKFK